MLNGGLWEDKASNYCTTWYITQDILTPTTNGAPIVNSMKMIKLYLISTNKTLEQHLHRTTQKHVDAHDLGSVEYKRGGKFALDLQTQCLLYPNVSC